MVLFIIKYGRKPYCINLVFNSNLVKWFYQSYSPERKGKAYREIFITTLIMRIRITYLVIQSVNFRYSRDRYPCPIERINFDICRSNHNIGSKVEGPISGHLPTMKPMPLAHLFLSISHTSFQPQAVTNSHHSSFLPSLYLFST